MDSEVLHVSLKDSSTTINTKGNILKCNEGVQLKEQEGVIKIENISNDTVCNFYDTSLDAVNHLDSTENYILFLANEEEEDHLHILEGQIVTLDLNGHSKNSTIQNDGILNVVSSNNEKGILNTTLPSKAIFMSYKNAKTTIQNMDVSASTGALSMLENSKAYILNSNLSASEGNSSSIYTQKNTYLEVTSSIITGPFGIGGTGGRIIIDNSEVNGLTHAGIEVNSGGTGDILIQNSSKVTGLTNGVHLNDAGTVTLNGTKESFPILKGTNISGIYFKDPSSIFNYNYGETYGKNSNNLPNQVNLRSGTTMQTKTKDGMVYTYLA